MVMMRRARQRQDLRTASAVERAVNDLAAVDTYEELLLAAIRSGADPNARAAVDDFAGYVPPTFDARRGAAATAQHVAAVAACMRARDACIQALRRNRSHQQCSAFDRLLRETEYYTGVRALDAADDDAADADAAAPLLDVPRLTTTPSYIRGVLRPYQVEGVNWLLGLFRNGVNGILADEMGLGKTFQTIALLAYLKYTVGVGGPHLVVCPKSVMGNWFREFRHWCPALSVYKLHAPSDVRASLIKAHLHPLMASTHRAGTRHPHDQQHNSNSSNKDDGDDDEKAEATVVEPERQRGGGCPRHDVVVTTFETVLDELGTFRRIAWQYLIVDEAHKLKNDEGKAHTALTSLRATHRLIITGTPLQNNLKELWALLHFLAPRLFDDAAAFDAWFDTASGQQDVDAMTNLHKILAPLMLRRLKADVSTGIPPKREIYVACQLSKKQREWYLHVLAKDAEVLNKANSSTASLNNVLMNLRKVINHPYLMDGAEDGPPFVTDEKLVRASGKMVIMDKLLHRLHGDVAGAHKVLIFSQFTSMLNILEDYCHMRRFAYCRIDGNTSGYDRDSQMAAFNAPGGDRFIFLLSTRAGGLGINLQAANHVILYDSDWNPQMDLQAQDRAHRIGQKRSVRVYRFVTEGTVEEKMYQRALKKLYLDAVVVQQGRLQQQQQQQQASSSRAGNAPSREELLSMIRFGAETVFKTRHDDVNEADLDRLLADGEARVDALSSEAQAQAQLSLASFQLGAEEANIYDFEGISYKAGVESRMLHLTLDAAVSQAELQARCAAYGEVTRVVLHPNLREALVCFRTTSGAIEAKSHLPYTATFASRDAQMVVTREMVSECLGSAGEKLGRGHRLREPVRFYTEAEVERLQTRTSKAARPLKLPKPPHYRPFQLYNATRLLELHNTEVALRVQRWQRRCEQDGGGGAEEHVASARGDVVCNGDSNNDNNSNNNDDATVVAPSSAAAVAGAKHRADDKDDGDVLTPVELEERERLLSEGFANWTYREYRTLLRVLASGRVDVSDYAAIAALLARSSGHGDDDGSNNKKSKQKEGNDEDGEDGEDGGKGKTDDDDDDDDEHSDRTADTHRAKTAGEVRDYVTALLERGEVCIPHFARVEARIRRAQARRQAAQDMLHAAKWKVESCARPETQLTFRAKGCVTLDRQLFLAGYEAGFRAPAAVVQAVRQLPENRLDVWCQSRERVFLERRLHTLLKSVKREREQPADDAAEEPARHVRRRVAEQTTL